MSDFLDRLAARSLADRPGVRPRPMPVFEPVAPDEPPATPRRAVAPSPLTATAPTFAAPSETGPRETVVSSVRETHREMTERQTSFLQTVVTEGAGVPEAPVAPLTLASSVPPPPVVSISHIEVPTRGVPVAFERTTLVQEERLREIAAALPPAKPIAFPTPLPIRPVPPAEPAPVVEAPTTPEVEIRIGRVEVRAEFATAPRRESPRPRGPQVSLDQYLEGRR